MYRVLIVEDSPSEAETLKGFLARYAAERNVQISVEVLPSALEFVNSKHAADLILMDIDMPGINGMEAAEILRTYDETTPLMFVTNLAQYAVKGYSVDALDFVVKPVEYDDFSMRMDRAVRVMKRNERHALSVATENGVCVVDQSEVAYIDLMRHDVCYHLADGSMLKEYGSLKAAEERLDSSIFLRINSGCLINMGQVRRVRNDSVIMSDGAELYFSRSQKKHALEALTNYFAGSV